MTTQELSLLFLNIHDSLEITLKNFFYKLTEEGSYKKLDYGYNKNTEEGWVACPTLRGKYCGFRSGELEFIKVHVTSFPFKMIKYTNGYLDYILLDTKAITSLSRVKKHKQSVMDRICHNISHVLNQKESDLNWCKKFPELFSGNFFWFDLIFFYFSTNPPDLPWQGGQRKINIFHKIPLWPKGVWGSG